jgi:hypothetical protein
MEILEPGKSCGWIQEVGNGVGHQLGIDLQALMSIKAATAHLSTATFQGEEHKPKSEAE